MSLTLVEEKIPFIFFCRPETDSPISLWDGQTVLANVLFSREGGKIIEIMITLFPRYHPFLMLLFFIRLMRLLVILRYESEVGSWEAGVG